MIKMMFRKNNAYFVITIDNKKILYSDAAQRKLWGTSLQYLPPDLDNVKKKIMLSRNKIPAEMLEFFKITDAELKEFEDAKDDNELKDIVLRDTKLHGCVLIDLQMK